MTPYALFGLAWLAPAAVAIVVLGVGRERRLGPHRLIWQPAVAVSAAFLILSATLVAGWALPDAADELGPQQHAAVRPALAASYQCGFLPFARVLEVDVDPDTRELRYRCGLTHLGLLAKSGMASCGDGTWMVPGMLDMRSGGDCRRPELFGGVSR